MSEIRVSTSPVNRPVKVFTFPGGEVSVQLDPDTIKGVSAGYEIWVYALIRSSNDLMALALTVDAIRRVKPNAEISLTMPYIPYARQDRVCNPGEALAVKVLADMINAMNFDSVTVSDAHSHVSTSLINNCVEIDQATLFKSFVTPDRIQAGIIDEFILVSPDAGAEKKILNLAKSLSTDTRTQEAIFASKVRDLATGQITGTRVPAYDARDQDLWIVDDICDGGRTFIELAKELRRSVQNFNKIKLFVTHGIFSKGIEVFKGHIDEVYCMHDWLHSGKTRSHYNLSND